MRKSATRFETISKIILSIISVTLSYFLISISQKVLDDVTRVYKPPRIDDFMNRESLDFYEAEIARFKSRIDSLNEKQSQTQQALRLAENVYASEKESFDAWIKTRKTIGSPGQDSEVLSRTRKLDELRNARDGWRSQSLHNLSSIAEREKEISLSEHHKRSLTQDAWGQLESASRTYNLKIFSIRLAFALPILAISAFLVIRYRKSKFSPFVWGYALFSLYVFFVGLVPYLPSYGGYIRYAVGIVLTIFVGYYVIRQLTTYTERKKADLAKSSLERAKDIQYESALKSFVSNTCPSCERNYFVIKNVTDTDPNFCIHCGLRIFGKCPACGQRIFAHFRHCSACGESISVEALSQQPAADLSPVSRKKK